MWWYIHPGRLITGCLLVLPAQWECRISTRLGQVQDSEMQSEGTVRCIQRRYSEDIYCSLRRWYTTTRKRLHEWRMIQVVYADGK
ncbi:hypothetical protein C8Q74DRAFT_963071 [Fomes fomentarius]|nr:hypothetical protein C8Q74DRAFT_963071 [Fomes fomentarius]